MNLSQFLGRLWRNINRRISRLYLDRSLGGRDAIGWVRIGSVENGWYAPPDMPVGARCYCIGVGQDASYDWALAERGAEVHAFDPTPHAIAYMQDHNRDRVTFHPWGMMDKDRTIRLYFPFDERHGSYFAEDLHGTGKYHEVPCYRFETIMGRLGHSSDSLYLVKMDIEGSWYQVLPDMVRSGILPQVLQVEYDSPAPLWRVRPVHRMLIGKGYHLVLREADNAIYHRQTG